MRALTLSQPWATLMVAPGIYPPNIIGTPQKRIESRSWRVSDATILADPFVAIHAAKTINAGVRHSISTGIEFKEPYASALASAGYFAFDPWHREYDERIHWASNVVRPLKPLPLGAVVGRVTLDRIVPAAVVRQWRKRGQISELEYSLGFYDEADGPRFGWVTTDPRQLETPVETRGYQQLWQLPPDVEDLVVARLPRKPQ